jgi:hypothetical protein
MDSINRSIISFNEYSSLPNAKILNESIIASDDLSPCSPQKSGVYPVDLRLKEIYSMLMKNPKNQPKFHTTRH